MAVKASADGPGQFGSGRGEFSVGDSISGGFTYQSRLEGGPGSNPEQLLGAAHASCFSMALASLLERDGTPAESIHTDAEVTIRLVDGTPTITKIDLSTVGISPGSRRGLFRRARARCQGQLPGEQGARRRARGESRRRLAAS